MRRLLVLTCLLAAALVPPASAAPPPEGQPCSWLLVGGSRWDGVLYGGPVTVPGSVVRIRCEIVTPSGAVLATSDSGPRNDVAATADVVSYVSDGDDLLCTTAMVDGTTWRWSDGGWTTGQVDCATETTDLGQVLADLLTVCTSLECGPLGFVHPLVDGTICDTNGGDVYVAGELFYDCPPYEVT